MGEALHLLEDGLHLLDILNGGGLSLGWELLDLGLNARFAPLRIHASALTIHPSKGISTLRLSATFSLRRSFCLGSAVAPFLFGKEKEIGKLPVSRPDEIFDDFARRCRWGKLRDGWRPILRGAGHDTGFLGCLIKEQWQLVVRPLDLQLQGGGIRADNANGGGPLVKVGRPISHLPRCL